MMLPLDSGGGWQKEALMGEYISKKLGIDKAVYGRVKFLLADYDRLKRARQMIVCGSPPPPNGMPRGRGVSSPTEAKAIRLLKIDEDLRAIDQSSMEVRGIYNGRVQEEFDPIRAYWSYDYFNYMVVRTEKMPCGPSKSTWNRFKYAFVKKIAEKKKYI